MQTLDPIKTKRWLLWCSFLTCLGFSAIMVAELVPGAKPIAASLLGICFMLPWLLHLAFLRPKLDLHAEARERSFGGFSILILACATVINVDLIAVGLVLGGLKVTGLTLHMGYLGVLLLLLFIGSVLLFFYVLTWSSEQFSRLPYHLALRHSMVLIAGPALFLLMFVAIQPDFARLMFDWRTSSEEQVYYLSVVIWCGLVLAWSAVPILYLVIMAKSYQELMREAEPEDIASAEWSPSGAGYPDWYVAEETASSTQD